jgi:two-component system OmpR family sensor kinase
MTPRRAPMRPGGPRRAQLRTRVLAGVLAVTLVALAGFDFAAVTALRGYLVGQTDSRLQTVLSLYRPLEEAVPASASGPARLPPKSKGVRAVPGPRLAKVPPGQVQKVVQFIGPRLLVPGVLGQYYVAAVSGRGESIAFVRGNADLVPPWAILRAGLDARTVISRNGQAQLRVLTARKAGRTLVAATSLAGVNKTVSRLELIIILGSLAAGLLVAVGIAWIMRRGLRPIETMAAQADRITAGDLTDRVSDQDPRTEVGRLGTALNGMLTRIEASVEEREASQELTRRFFADASHELRNPLASLRANAELYTQGAITERPQVDEAMRRIAHEAQRMSGLVDDMLRLARLDQHPGRQHDPVDLTELTRECVERARIASPGRSWHAAIAPGLTTTGDEEMLRRAIDNLLANVCAHTPAGAAATITAAGHGGTVTIEVSDDGPGVPADQLPRIFDRFYRAGAQPRLPGSGLGLAIVTAIASAHHGTAEASLNDPHGLRITLSLPGARPPRPAEEAAASAAASR